ncbi:hypothetical protein ONZ45_g3380 [Pleurotus djamor]|nr:hypothetical protein ONZ45_g3380 [Pleurotus djamor]
MQSLLGLRSKLPLRSFLTCFTRFSVTPSVPRFVPVPRARTIYTSNPVWFPSATGASTKAKPKAKASATTGRKKAVTAKSTTATKAKAKPKAKPKPKKKPLRAASKKKVAAKKPKKKVVKPKPLKVNKSMAPPLGYRGPYLAFHVERMKTMEKPSSLDALREFSRESGAAWRAMSEEERQPWYDLAAANKEAYFKKREEYFKNYDPAVLRALNKKRRSKGVYSYRIRTPIEDRKPPSSFFRYLAEFRNSDEAQGLSQKEISVRGGAAWKAFSDAEKAPYVEAYKKDVELFELRR